MLRCRKVRRTYLLIFLILNLRGKCTLDYCNIYINFCFFGIESASDALHLNSFSDPCTFERVLCIIMLGDGPSLSILLHRSTVDVLVFHRLYDHGVLPKSNAFYCDWYIGDNFLVCLVNVFAVAVLLFMLLVCKTGYFGKKLSEKIT